MRACGWLASGVLDAHCNDLCRAGKSVTVRGFPAPSRHRMTATIVLIAVLATAVLSGVLGMAGGMVLMAVLVTVLPVATAMVVHGFAQGASNGARVWFLRRHVMWDVVPPLLGGRRTCHDGVRMGRLRAGTRTGADSRRRLALAGARRAVPARPGHTQPGHGRRLRCHRHRRAVACRRVGSPTRCLLPEY